MLHFAITLAHFFSSCPNSIISKLVIKTRITVCLKWNVYSSMKIVFKSDTDTGIHE